MPKAKLELASSNAERRTCSADWKSGLYGTLRSALKSPLLSGLVLLAVHPKLRVCAERIKESRVRRRKLVLH